MKNNYYFDENDRFTYKNEPEISSSMTERIANLHPHYTNSYFKESRLVWGKKQGKHCDYSDRLYEWNYNKAKNSHDEAKKSVGNDCTAQFFQEYLSLYYGKSVVLHGIMAGFNLSNGYPYQVFCFDFAE